VGVTGCICDAQNYNTLRRRRRQNKLSELLEYQQAQKRRERKWIDHIGRERKVEHALLDIDRATSGDRDVLYALTSAPVCTGFSFL